MTFTKAILALACLMPGTLVAQAAKVTPLFSEDLTNLRGKEGLMVTVEYPPGSSDPIHRHNAYGFIYVLEGSIVMQHAGERSFRDFFRLPLTSWWSLRVAHNDKLMDQSPIGSRTTRTPHRHRAVVVVSIKTMLFTPSESHADAFGEHRRWSQNGHNKLAILTS